MSVTAVTSDAELDELIAFASTLYADDPTWVAPPRELLRHKLKPKNPRFRSAEIKLYLARRGDTVVGTISALRDHKHESHKGERTVFFGFFECIDDQEVAEALVATVAEQARAWGADTLRGPRDLSRSEEVGVVIEGAHKPSPMLASHNKTRYAAMLEGLGFVKHHDVLAYEIDVYDEHGNPAPYPQEMLDRANAVQIDGLEVHPARWWRILRDLALAHQVFVEAFRDVPENTPMTLRQFTSLGLGLLFFSNRHMLQLATVNGKAAGFALCFPEMNEALRHANGRLLPWGWLKVLFAIPRIETASFKLIGVMPEYRNSGLVTLMIVRAVEGVRESGYRRIEGSLIDERNTGSRGVVEGIGMRIYKRWRLFDLAL